MRLQESEFTKGACSNIRFLYQIPSLCYNPSTAAQQEKTDWGNTNREFCTKNTATWKTPAITQITEESF